MILFSNNKQFKKAFTLVEMLTVVAVIAILAALIVTTMSLATQKAVIKSAESNLKALEMAIESYKGEIGQYPADNPGNATSTNMALTPLFYELTGTIVTNTGGIAYKSTVDPKHLMTSGNASSLFNRAGFDNAADEARDAREKNFYKMLKTENYSMASVSGVDVYLMSLPAPWSTAAMGANPLGGVNTVNPWFYNSTSPTNNAGTYDLWGMVSLRGEARVISNWRK
jgi:prepilin-type N-terminal cleavage/methylation domain-containing protein